MSILKIPQPHLLCHFLFHMTTTTGPPTNPQQQTTFYVTTKSYYGDRSAGLALVQPTMPSTCGLGLILGLKLESRVLGMISYRCLD